MTRKDLTALWKTEVADRAEEIDPNSAHDWLGICYGWAIAKGLEPDEAHKFAIFIRYGTDLG